MRRSTTSTSSTTSSRRSAQRRAAQRPADRQRTARRAHRHHLRQRGLDSTPSAFFDRLAAGRHPGPAVQSAQAAGAGTSPSTTATTASCCWPTASVAIIGGVNLSTDYQSGTFAAPASRNAQTGARTRALARYRSADRRSRRQRSQAAVRAALAAAGWRRGPRRGHPEHVTAQGDQVVRIIGSQAGQRLVTALLRDAAVGDPQRRHRIESRRPISRPLTRSSRALLHAARRGVHVRLLLPSHSDSSPALAVQRSHYSCPAARAASRSMSARMASCIPRPWSRTASGRSSAHRISIIAACCSTMRSTRW